MTGPQENKAEGRRNLLNDDWCNTTDIITAITRSTLRLGGQETCNGEVSNAYTQYLYLDILNGIANLGELDKNGELSICSMRIWTYALKFVLCSDQKVTCFCFVTSSTTAHNAQSNKFLFLNYLQNLCLVYEVTSTSLLSRDTLLLLLYVATVVTVFNMYR